MLLLKTFERETQMTVPRANVDQRAQIAATLELLEARLIGKGGNTLPVVAAPPVLSAVPPMPHRYLHRPKLETRIDNALRHYGVALITGSRQAGKTTIALSVSRHEGPSCLWLDLSTRNGPDAVDLLQRAAAELSTHKDSSAVVIDGLPDSATLAVPLGLALATLLDIVRGATGTVILTADHQLPAALAQAAHFPNDAAVPLTPFDADEIRQFLVQQGCESSRADEWTRILEFTTAGVPLLVHARVAALEERGFPAPTIDDLLATSPEVASARRDVRMTASETLSAEALEMLTRLSLGGHAYDRELALRIAYITPAVPAAGNALDRLVGPWLKDLGAQRYRVYPIGFSLGTGVHGDAWTKQMHGAIGSAMMHTDQLSTHAAADVLMHGLLGEDEGVLNSVLGSMFSADREAWSTFAAASGSFSSVWVGEASRPEGLSKTTRALLRLAQIRVAIIELGRVPEALLAVFDEEFHSKSKDVQERVTRFLGLTEIITHSRNAMEIAHSLALAEEWAQLGGEFIAQDYLLQGEPKAIVLDEAGKFDPVAAIGFMLLAEVGSPRKLHEFLDAMESRNSELQRRVLALVARDRTYAHGFVQQIWLPQVRADRNDWAEPLIAMRRAYDHMDTLGLLLIADVFGEAVVRVTIEYGDGAAAGLAEADALLVRRSESPMPDLRAARAQALIALGDEQTGLAILREVLPSREWDGVELTPLLDYRRAAVAEAQGGKWTAAARWLADLEARLDADSNLLWKIASGIDAAYARWRGNDATGALDPLRAAIELLATLTIDPADARQFMVLKRIGHTTMWMSSLGEPGGQFDAPPPAYASNLDTELPAGLPVPPPTPVDVVIAHALLFEFLVGGGGALANKYEARLAASPLPLVRASAGWPAGFRAASVGATRGVVALIAAADSAMADFADASGTQGVAPRPFYATGLRLMLITCCIRPALSGTLDENVVAAWREEAAAAGVADALRPTLDTLDALFVHGSLDPAVAMQSEHNDIELQVLGSLRYASMQQVSAAGWLRVHGILATFFSALPHLQLAGALFVRLLQERWRCTVVQRFALAAPAVNAPALEAALDAQGTPWQRVRGILLAAERASTASLPGALRAKLESLAAERM